MAGKFNREVSRVDRLYAVYRELTAVLGLREVALNTIDMGHVFLT